MALPSTLPVDQTAVMWRRAASWFLDVLLLGGLVAFAGEAFPDQQNLAIVAVVAAFFVANLTLLQGLTGATIGKWATSLRVVRHDGTICGIGPAAIRSVLWLIDGIPCGSLLPLVAIVCSLSSRGHRRVGDMAAATLVVDKTAVGRPISVPGLTVGIASGYGPMPDATYLPGIPHAGDLHGPRWDPQTQSYLVYNEETGAWEPSRP